jgi:hypothetical protein
LVLELPAQRSSTGQDELTKGHSARLLITFSSQAAAGDQEGGSKEFSTLAEGSTAWFDPVSAQRQVLVRTDRSRILRAGNRGS